jgi:hypothetical protein
MAAGKATGVAIIAPPMAAKLKPTVRIVLKNFDVGAAKRSINVNFLLVMFFFIKNERLNMTYPLFKKLNSLVHQLINSLEFGFNNRSGGFYFTQVFFDTLKIPVQLLYKESHHREKQRNYYPE